MGSNPKIGMVMSEKSIPASLRWTLLIALILPLNLLAQGIPPNILHVEIEDYAPGEPLKFKTIVTDDGEIGKLLLYFRTPGKPQFDFTNFYLEQDFYVAEISPEFLEFGTLEYYIYAEDEEGAKRTLPEINPEINPYEYAVAPTGGGNPAKITLLSPEPGSAIPREPELVVISLFDPEDDIVTASIKLIVDGKDVTNQALITNDIITYMPLEVMSTGGHSIQVTARDKAGNITPPASFDFSVQEFKPVKKTEVKYNVFTSWETRYDKYDGKEQPVNRPIDHNKPRVRATIDAGWLKTEAEVFYNFYFDEEAQTQADRRQTLNRYRIKFDTKPLTLIFGDGNPRFSELTIKGTRIRGVSADVRLGFFGLSTFVGEARNKVAPYFLTDTDSTLIDSVISASDTTYIYQYETGAPTYQRQAFGLRTTFTAPRNAEGIFNTAELGFNYLRFKANTDDSLSFRQDIIEIGGYTYADYDSSTLALYLQGQGYSPGDAEWDEAFQRWAADTSAVIGKLGSPKDNIVISSTLNFRLFRKTFVSFEAALSLLIDNMYASRKDIDEIIADQDSGLALSANDQLVLDIDNFMSDNFNFRINNSLIPFGAIQPALFFDLRTPLPYLPTNFNLNYRRVPDSYTSLGNPSIQSDVDAIKADTRTRMFGNAVNLTLGGEVKKDNLYNNKQVTTSTNTLSSGIGLMLPKWPSLNIGYRMITREGVKDTTEITYIYNLPIDSTIIDSTSLTYQITPSENTTNTITASAGYQVKSGEWQANLNLNLMLMSYADAKNSDYNFDNNSLIFSSTLTPPYPWSIDLGLGRSTNAPETATKTIYSIFNLRFNYYFMNRLFTTYAGVDYLTGEKIEDIDPVDGPMGNAVDNVKRSLRAGMKWKITGNMSLAMEVENIDLEDAVDAENTYAENRAKFKWEWRF